MAEGDLCTVAQAKELLGITTSSADDLLARLVSAASAAVKQALEDDVLEADYDERYPGTGATALLLRHAPVTLVLGVEVSGVSVPRATTATAAGWFLDGRVLRLRGWQFTGGPGAVRVRYTAGYDSSEVPADIEDAVLDTVALAYRRRDNLDVASKSLAGETISFINSAMRARAREMVVARRERVPA